MYSANSRTDSSDSFSGTMSSRYIPNMTETTSSSDESGANSRATTPENRRTGFRDWSNWRTNLNEKMIKTMQQQKNKYLDNPKMSIQRHVSDFAVSTVMRDHMVAFTRPELHDVPSLLSFGIPRANLHQKHTEPKKPIYKKKRHRGKVRWH